MAAKVTVGCRLPHGIIIEHPVDPTQRVTLAGRNKAVILGAEYATTEVDADFWGAWLGVNGEFPALQSGAIFVAKNAADAAAQADELKDEKTGFEAMSQSAHGVKPADKE